MNMNWEAEGESEKQRNTTTEEFFFTPQSKTISKFPVTPGLGPFRREGLFQAVYFLSVYFT
jgi:hypothetical protein